MVDDRQGERRRKWFRALDLENNGRRRAAGSIHSSRPPRRIPLARKGAISVSGGSGPFPRRGVRARHGRDVRRDEGGGPAGRTCGTRPAGLKPYVWVEGETIVQFHG